jgi:hypothetical protein
MGGKEKWRGQDFPPEADAPLAQNLGFYDNFRYNNKTGEGRI